MWKEDECRSEAGSEGGGRGPRAKDRRARGQQAPERGRPSNKSRAGLQNSTRASDRHSPIREEENPKTKVSQINGCRFNPLRMAPSLTKLLQTNLIAP